MSVRPAVLVLGLLLVPALVAPVRAEITLGAILSLTGPAAGVGVPQRDAIALLPAEIAGQAVRWVVADDATDPATAVKAARRLIDEEHVDAILGASTGPASLAVVEVGGAAGVPMFSLSDSRAVVDPQSGARRWAFKLAAGDASAAAGLVDRMAAEGAKTLAQLGSDSPRDAARLKAVTDAAAAKGIRTVVDARPGDADPAPQLLRIASAKPDAVFVAQPAAATAATVGGLRARGYAGPVYTVQDAAGPDTLGADGAVLDGTMFAASPVLVADLLPADSPVKAPATAFLHAWEGRYGSASRALPGAAVWDAVQLIAAAAPDALKDGEPGTPKFRTGLRNALERVRGFPGAEAVYSFSPDNHGAAQASNEVMVEVRNGAYRLLPPPPPSPAEAAPPGAPSTGTTPADTTPAEATK